MARYKNEIIFFQRFFSDSAFETNEAVYKNQNKKKTNNLR